MVLYGNDLDFHKYTKTPGMISITMCYGYQAQAEASSEEDHHDEEPVVSRTPKSCKCCTSS